MRVVKIGDAVFEAVVRQVMPGADPKKLERIDVETPGEFVRYIR